ncbi:hypothetical protein [Methylobacterium gnaphalii]|uniref:Uncharacterized protein n=1 Tax=Methylobacterium gnaphalii TaxID=1010610 RepID=A0A512JIT9_9HYPH|nr:hypothetical protein [Methylobacterium gnaphalii]GEP09869.1 hypothetical protein MGN01_17140 [Methylobacterium gnaphalii]GJD67215.1 hypothetical protein MMMDOFMJ_0129 [Methylobacterium gnaphalii]GLS49898.1 hypothetical protein GCM10007885_27500 [Methylobacterium gnaphalii]
MNPLAAFAIVLIGFIALALVLIPVLDDELRRAVARLPANDKATAEDIEEEARRVG